MGNKVTTDDGRLSLTFDMDKVYAAMRRAGHPGHFAQPDSSRRIVNHLGQPMVGAQPSDYPLAGTCGTCGICGSGIVLTDGTADWAHGNVTDRH